jgi:hypothetical protein
MPCFCDASNEEMDHVKKDIKHLSLEIVDHIKRVSHPTSRYPELLKDTLKAIEHMYTGECDERQRANSDR